MADFRNPDDPLQRDVTYDPNARSVNGVWGWIAGAVFVVVILAIAFGAAHRPNDGTRIANNTVPPATHSMNPPAANPANPPAVNPTAPPATGPASRSFAPPPANPIPAHP